MAIREVQLIPRTSSEVDRLRLVDAYQCYWTLAETESLDLYRSAYRKIVRLESQADPMVAWQTLREAAMTYHAETRICPFCGARGVLHLPAEQLETELLGRP